MSEELKFHQVAYVVKDLDKAVKMYLKYNAVPDQIAGDDTQGTNVYIIEEYNRVTY